MRTLGLHIVAAALLLVGCRQEMADQPRYEPYEIGAMFEDSLAMRRPVAGTVPRSHPLRNAYRPRRVGGEFLLQGPEAGQQIAGIEDGEQEGQVRQDGQVQLEGQVQQEGEVQQNGRTAPPAIGADAGYPFPITERVLFRGKQRFDIFCSPCHGRAGYGAGIIVQRGLRKPPSFHTDRLRQAPPSHFYSVITEGYGAMYSYASRVEPADRWAIAAYIQTLQMSQHAQASLLPDTLNNLPARVTE